MASRGLGLAIKPSMRGDKVRKRLQELKRRGGHLNPAMRSSATLMQQNIMSHFDTKRGSGGETWPLVSIGYAEWKDQQGRDSGNTLVFDGTLRGSFIRGTTHGRNYATVGTSVLYAPIHNYGSSRMPKREFMYIDPKVVGNIRRVILDYILKNARGS